MSGSTVAFGIEIDSEEKLIIVQEIDRSFIRDLDSEKEKAKISTTISSELGILVHEIVFVQPYSLEKTTSGKLMRTKTKQRYNSQKLKTI